MNQTVLFFSAIVFFGLGFLSGYLVFKITQASQPAEKLPEEPLEQETQPQPAAVTARPEITPPVPTLPKSSLPAPAQVFDPPPLPARKNQPAVPASNVQPVSMNPLISAARIAQRGPKPNLKPISVQIDEILQEKISQAGEIFDGLRLVDQPDHTLGVTLAGQTYPGIESVPDEKARELIRKAVEEWRQRQR